MNPVIVVTAIIAVFLLGCVLITAIRDVRLAKHKAASRYPYPDGDVTVLGPEIFASNDGQAISWKGDNYERQQERP